MHNMIIEEERDHNLSIVLEPMRIENTHQNLNFEEFSKNELKFKTNICIVN